MVVQPCDRVVVWSAVKHLSNLLQKALSVELSGTHEGVFPQEDVLTFECGIETIYE